MRCYVCGAERQDVGDCTECGTVSALQQRLLTQTARSRFLFGRIRPDEVEIQRQAAPVPRREARTRKAVKPRPAPIIHARDFSMPMEPDPDLIRARDIVEELEVPVAEEPQRLAHRAVPYTINVLTCTLLNLLVLQLILWFSGRDFQPLVVFSLVPLFFVLICFTALYFGLFAMTFGKSFGRLVFEHWSRRA